MAEKLVRPKDEAALVRSVVNGILDGRAEAHQALNLVPSDAFTWWVAKDVWEAIGSLVHSGNPPDFPSIERQLHAQGKLTKGDSWTRYENMLEDGHGWEDELKLGNTVLGLYQRRELIKRYQLAAEEAGNLLVDHLETAQNTMSQTLNIISGGVDEPELAGQSILAAVNAHQKFQEDQEAPGKLAYFGVQSLDASVEEGGIPAAPGHIVIVAGRPGNFKTTWAVQTLGATATKDTECLFVSLELSAWEVKKRLAAWFTECKQSTYWYGTYTEYQSGRLRSSKQTLDKIHIWAPPKASWSRIEAKIRGAALKGIKVVVLDHFGLIGKEGIRLHNDANSFDFKRHIAERLRELVKELKINIVLLAQLNRAIEKGKAPDMENLRETGALEEVAYSIVVLWHDETKESAPSIMGPDAPPPIPTQFKYTVVKNRDGKAFYTKKINPDGSTCHIKEVN